MKRVGCFLFYFFLLIAQNSVAEVQSVTSLSSLEGVTPETKYRREVFNSLVEYPLSKSQSVGTLLQASHGNFKRADEINSTQAYALNSAEIFHRYRFFSYKKFGLTLHNSYKFPGIYNENEKIGLPPKQSDYEMRLFVGYNFQDRTTNQIIRGTNPYFIRTEIAYRRRFSNPFDEVRFGLLAGLKLNSKFVLLLQDNVIWNVAAKADDANNSYKNVANFRYNKNANNIATMSLVYRCNEQIALQAGYLRRVDGNEKFYDSQGVIFGLWTSF